MALKKTTNGAALAELEARLGHVYARRALLTEALTHGSLRHEQPDGGGGDNERLEFLGDAIVGLLVAELLYRRFPTASEGELTRLRAALVSRKHLGEVGLGLELGRWLRLGRSEERSGGRTKAVLLANCVEAITAAMYLDGGGLEAPAAFVERVVVEPYVDGLYKELEANSAIGDFKSALQELLQARGVGQPEYTVADETGPDHRKRFCVEVHGDGRALAQGVGSTKKKAEQEAAKRALGKLAGDGHKLPPGGADELTDGSTA